MDQKAKETVKWTKRRLFKYGCLAYIGLFYVCNMIHIFKQARRGNVMNLAHLLPQISSKSINKYNLLQKRQSFYESIARLEERVKQIYNQKSQIIIDLNQKNNATSKEDGKQNKSGSETKQYQQHSKVTYAQKYKIVFEQEYLWGSITVPKKLDLQSSCDKLWYKQKQLFLCYEKTAAVQNIVRNYLYRSEIKNEMLKNIEVDD